VAIVDSRPFGGTCALRGCDPKKVLVGAAALIDWIRRMESKGVRGDNASTGFHRKEGGRVKEVTHRWPRACFMSLPCLVPRPPAGILSKNI